MINYLKKLRKELEKWLEIPKVLIENHQLKKDNEQLNDDKEQLNRDITFVTNNEHKRTEEVIKLKKEIESLKGSK